ncbi:hypothetical protein FWD20_00105 [Candidatus Saccharibacteria bacterium]|nr:hypothetical protein [Candidatus Saccharibacteria bacterium]
MAERLSSAIERYEGRDSLPQKPGAFTGAGYFEEPDGYADPELMPDDHIDPKTMKSIIHSDKTAWGMLAARHVREQSAQTDTEAEPSQLDEVSADLDNLGALIEQPMYEEAAAWAERSRIMAEQEMSWLERDDAIRTEEGIAWKEYWQKYAVMFMPQDCKESPADRRIRLRENYVGRALFLTTVMGSASVKGHRVDYSKPGKRNREKRELPYWVGEVDRLARRAGIKLSDGIVPVQQPRRHKKRPAVDAERNTQQSNKQPSMRRPATATVQL